jgi:uncharacterized membrane protein
MFDADLIAGTSPAISFFTSSGVISMGFSLGLD